MTRTSRGIAIAAVTLAALRPAPARASVGAWLRRAVTGQREAPRGQEPRRMSELLREAEAAPAAAQGPRVAPAARVNPAHFEDLRQPPEAAASARPAVARVAPMRFEPLRPMAPLTELTPLAQPPDFVPLPARRQDQQQAPARPQDLLTALGAGALGGAAMGGDGLGSASNFSGALSRNATRRTFSGIDDQFRRDQGLAQQDAARDQIRQMREQTERAERARRQADQARPDKAPGFNPTPPPPPTPLNDSLQNPFGPNGIFNQNNINLGGGGFNGL